MNNFAGFSAIWALLLLLIFGILQLLNMPTGNFLDWLIGGASFWWLMLIVTVPWNIHFEAKEVLAEAIESQEKGIEVDAKQLNYVQLLANRSFAFAIGLHLISAIALYALAATGISAIGYVSSIASLLLTLLRPAIRLYQYLAMRLATIKQQFLYPRPDILEVRERLLLLEGNVREIQRTLNPDDSDSWAGKQMQQWATLRTDLTRLAATMEDFKSVNQAEHIKLARDAENAIGQLSRDSQFLSHVQEIIRFFKEA